MAKEEKKISKKLIEKKINAEQSKKDTTKQKKLTQKEKLKEFEEKKPVIKKKEKKETKKTFELLKIPVYIWAIFLILGLVGGVALSLYMQPENQTIIILDDNGEEDKVMEIELIYSLECKFCVNHNTILDTLIFNGIPFTVKEIEATSIEGVEKLEIFKPIALPAALVPVKGLNKFTEIKEAMDQSFLKIEGFYVVPESNLDSTKLYSRVYVKPVDPTDCNVMDPKIDIILFDDPYNEIMIKTQPVLSQILTNYKEHINVLYEYIPSNVTTLKKDADPKIVKLTPEYLVCTGSQGLFIEGYNRTLAVYCGGQDYILNSENIEFCELSPHFGTPLTFEEIEAATVEMKEIEPRPFDSCLLFAEELTQNSIKRAQQYGLTRTGTAIVDCRFNVPYQAIDNAICVINPEIELCSNDE